MVSKNVLIVEDELIIALMLEQMVTQMGYNVVDKVTTGELAIEKATMLQPDIILMDIRLQGEIDGVEAISEIQKMHDIPVIYITGNTDQQHQSRLKKTEYLDFLVKPITQNKLSHSLDLAS
jgi:CheY-like chemotaxis protein